MTDKEIIRNHYIFSTTHELDDDNKFLKEYILNLEHENKQLKDKDEKISKVIEYCLNEREDINGSKCDDILEILESNKED